MFLKLFFIFFSFSLFANSKIETQLKKSCFNPEIVQATEAIDGLHYFFIQIQDKDGEKKVLDCSRFGIGPVLASEFEESKTGISSVICNAPVNQEDLGIIRKLNESVNDVTSGGLCKEEEKTPLISSKCGKEMGCNLLRSLLNLTTLGTFSYLSPLLNKDNSSSDTCLDSKKSDCLMELGAGIVKNIWANIEGVGFLLKSAAGWAWDGIKGFAGQLFSSKEAVAVEDKSSDAMHLASELEPSLIDKFKESPKDFMVDMGNRFYQYLMKTVADSFGCEKWSGAPHISKCEKHLGSWECSNCDQRLNSICGIVGFLGGEIVTAFLTGGTINLLGKAGRASGMAKIFSPLGHKLDQSKSLSKIGVGVEKLGKVILLPFKPLAKIPGIKQYLHLTEEAFTSGLKVGKTPPISLATTSKIKLSKQRAQSPKKSMPKAVKSDSAVESSSSMKRSSSVIVDEADQLDNLSTFITKQLQEEGKMVSIFQTQAYVNNQLAKEILKLPKEEVLQNFRNVWMKLEEARKKRMRVKLHPNDVPKKDTDRLWGGQSQLSYTDLKPLKGRKFDAVEKHLKKRKIVSSEPIEEGVNLSRKVVLDDGTVAIWKPHLEVWASNYRAEVLAYEIDRKFGFGIVPPTVERVVDGYKGSIQLWKKGHKEAAKLKVQEKNKLSLFDYLINNRDRHSDNLLISPQGDAIAIDHGLSFTGIHGNFARPFPERREEIFEFLNSKEGRVIFAKLKDLDLISFQKDAASYLGRADAENMVERIKYLVFLYEKSKKTP